MMTKDKSDIYVSSSVDLTTRDKIIDIYVIDHYILIKQNMYEKENIISYFS